MSWGCFTTVSDKTDGERERGKTSRGKSDDTCSLRRNLNLFSSILSLSLCTLADTH